MKSKLATLDFSSLVLVAIYGMVFILALSGCGSKPEAGVTSIAQLLKAIAPVVQEGSAVGSEANALAECLSKKHLCHSQSCNGTYRQCLTGK